MHILYAALSFPKNLWYACTMCYYKMHHEMHNTGVLELRKNLNTHQNICGTTGEAKTGIHGTG